MSNLDSQPAVSYLSADKRVCGDKWRVLEREARDLVKHVPFDLWVCGERQAVNLSGAGVRFVTPVWKKWHFFKIRSFPRFTVYVGVDGMLYDLDEDLRVNRRFNASDFTLEEIEWLIEQCKTLFRCSIATERLYTLVEAAIVKANTPPQSKVLGTGYKIRVTVPVPMPGDRCILSSDSYGLPLFQESVWARYLQGTEFVVDEKHRLIRSSSSYGPSVAHLRSIMERDRLRALLEALKSD